MSKNYSLLNINHYFDNDTQNQLENASKAGLGNSSNTCYLNSIIQLLGHCFPFTQMILEKDFTQIISDDKNTKPSISIELKEILNLMWIKHHSIKPNKFLKALQLNFDFIDIYSQQDSSEILGFILDKLNQELKTEINFNINDICYNDVLSKKLSKVCDREAYKFHKNEYSEIIELFYGQIINQTKCSECSKIHQSQDYFSCLKLEIPEDDNMTLEKCIKSYFTSFYLNDNNEKEWKCDKCNTYSKNKKIAKIWKMPPLLFISFKRFKADATKIGKTVEIPKNISFDDYCICSDNTNCNYKLVGTSIHLGRFNNGHYITIVRNNSSYVLIDDVNIQNIKEEDAIKLINENSYMLLYKVDTQLFSDE